MFNTEAGFNDRGASMTPPQTIAQCVVEIGFAINLFGGRFEIITDTAIFNLHRGLIQNHIAGTVVLVARLADAADVDHQFALAQSVLMVALVRWNEFAFGGEHARQVGVPHEAVPRDLAEQNLHLSLVINILRKTYSFVGSRGDA
jgi:hypothetical protein